MITSRQSCGGFTLVEVLVAMAIVSVSFLALYGSMQQIVQATTLMQDKTFATWVAQDQIAELRLATTLPDGNTLTGTREQGGMQWRYTVDVRETDSEAIRQLVVRVTPIDSPDQVIGLATGVLLIQPGSAGSNFGDSGTALASSLPDTGSFPATDAGDPALATEGELE